MFSVTNNENLVDENRQADEIFDEVKGYCRQRNKKQRPRAAATKSANVAEKTGTAEQQNQSTVSSTSSERATSSANTTQKTSDSDFPGAKSETGKSEDRCMVHRQNKATSFQDIHSEYTKRRYKDVPSKVGQLIAQAEAEDRKRINAKKFQRYNSMPETLTPTHTIAGSSRFNDDDSHKYEIERLQSYNEHLQTKLNDRMCEIVQLKRNMDTTRIELTQCQDKLKRQIINSTMLQQHSLHSIHHCAIKSITKATQTELVTPKRELSNVTPASERSGNLYSSGSGGIGGTNLRNKLGNSKNAISMQPLLLNFSDGSARGNGNNSRELGHTSTVARATTNNSGASSDSAIEIETAGLRSPMRQAAQLLSRSARQEKTSFVGPKRYFFYEKNLKRYIELGPVITDNSNTTDDTNTSYADILASAYARNAVRLKEKQSLRMRLLRIFIPCTRCNEAVLSVDEIEYVQAPFLNITGDSSRT